MGCFFLVPPEVDRVEASEVVEAMATVFMPSVVSSSTHRMWTLVATRYRGVDDWNQWKNVHSRHL